MATIQINELDLTPALIELIQSKAAEIGRQQAKEFIDEYKKRIEYPRYMYYTQAAKYMNTSYVTLKKIFVEKMGLPVVMVEGYEKIDQKDADAFLEKYKK